MVVLASALALAILMTSNSA
jgi:hypothetical protein